MRKKATTEPFLCQTFPKRRKKLGEKAPEASSGTANQMGRGISRSPKDKIIFVIERSEEGRGCEKGTLSDKKCFAHGRDQRFEEKNPRGE